jgi:hypothetical protein
LNKVLKRVLTTNNLLVYIGIIVLVFVVLLSLLSSGTTLTADDFQFYAYINNHSLLTAFENYGAALTGRYGNAFILILSIKTLGSQAVKILPFLSFSLMVAGVCFTIYNLTFLIKSFNQSMLKLLMLTGSLMVIAGLVTAPSIFDTYVWFAASTVYVTAGAVLAIASSILSASLRTEKESVWSYVAVFLLVLFAGGFYEFIPILLVIVGVVGIIIVIYKKQSMRSSLIKRFFVFSVLILVAGIISGLLLRFSPWTAMRISHSPHANISIITAHIFNHLKLITYYVFSWRVLFSVAIGAMLYLALGSVLKTYLHYLIWLITAICLTLLPLLSVATLAAVSGLIEPTGMASSRLLYVATTGIMLGCSIFIYGLLCFFYKFKIPGKKEVLYVGIFIVLSVATAAGTISLTKVIHAVYLKKSMVEYREAVIKYDLASNKNYVRLYPAPILLQNSQVWDIAFAGHPQYWLKAVRIYYHIPMNKTIDIPVNIPAGYCTTYSGNSIYSKYNCSEIAPDDKTQTYQSY